MVVATRSNPPGAMRENDRKGLRQRDEMWQIDCADRKRTPDADTQALVCGLGGRKRLKSYSLSKKEERQKGDRTIDEQHAGQATALHTRMRLYYCHEGTM